MQKEHWDFPGGARALGELGEEEAGPTSKEPLLSSLPSSALPALQKAGTVCCWGWNVPCVSYGLCPVLHWLLYIYTYFFSCGILFSVTPALVCSPLTCPLPHTMGHFGFETLIGSAGGVQREPWRREVGPETVKPLVLFLSPITQP